MPETDETEDRHVRPFNEWLLEQRTGSTHNELSTGLNDLVDAVSTTGKAGELRLTVKIKPAARGGNTVVVVDAVTLKLPEPEREETLFFVDRNANLSRSNPAQPSLPLRSVPDEHPAGDDKEVGS